MTRALVYSLGIEGRDLAGWLMGRGYRVTVSDTRSDEQLAAAGAAVPDGVERAVTGQPLLEPDGFDLVAVSQSVLARDPALVRARELGIPTTSLMQLFLQECRGRVVGITGSSGKSTTTALVAAMARAAGADPGVGGNNGSLGRSLVARVTDIGPGTTVILEISHTQLQYTDRSPHVAAVTNLTPNHLDQFSWDGYVDLKRNLLAHQGPDGIAVLNADDPATTDLLRPCVLGDLRLCSLTGAVDGPGAWSDGDRIMVRTADRFSGRAEPVVGRDAVATRGRHNLANTVMAVAIGGAAGWPVGAMAAAVRAFRGIPHRLEVVAEVGGATWVNDSIATSPERTMAGLRAFEEPVVLLLGGRDKNLPLDGLAALAATRCRAVVCFGESGDLFAGAVGPVVGDTTRVTTLDDAVALAATKAEPGDVVLLSPAGTSFDAYPNFEARGDAFRRAVAGFGD